MGEGWIKLISVLRAVGEGLNFVLRGAMARRVGGIRSW